MVIFIVRIGNHIISSAIWNKYARVNFFKHKQNCTSFTSAYLFQIARENSCDYVLIIYMKKYEIAFHNYAEAKRAHLVQK